MNKEEQIKKMQDKVNESLIVQKMRQQIDEKWAKVKRTIDYLDGAYKHNGLFYCQENIDMCDQILKCAGFDVDKVYMCS